MELTNVLFWLDAGVCSQQPGHSFVVGGQQLPVCARDLGMFGCFLLGAIVLNLVGKRPPFSFWWLLGLLPLLVDGTNSLAAGITGVGFYATSNALRLTTGGIAGASLAALTAPRLSHWAMLLSIALALTLGVTGQAYLLVGLLATAGIVVMLRGAGQLAAAHFYPRLGHLPSVRLWWLAALGLLALASLKQAAVAMLG